MSSSLEFEDKNVEMAIQKACEELNIPREKLKHNVISYGSTGIFGLVGTKKAKIKVALPESSREETSQNAGADKQKGRVYDRAVKSTDSKIDVAQKEQNAVDPDDDPHEIGQRALQRIVDLITSDATISISERSNRIFFNVKGGNSAVLIGKRGQTLEAIQYLVEKIINKNRAKRIGIRVDVEGYLEKRRISLQRLAVRLSEKVKRTGKPATIGQMNSHDRRIVHITLKDDHLVRTQSMGDGILKKLVIFPKKNSPRKRRP